MMDANSAKDREVSRWIEKHAKDIIYCPHQPGLLIISKKACLKRYRAALARTFENVSAEDPFHFALKKGLTLCEGCPIGRRLVQEEGNRASGRKKKRSVARKA